MHNPDFSDDPSSSLFDWSDFLDFNIPDTPSLPSYHTNPDADHHTISIPYTHSHDQTNQPKTVSHPLVDQEDPATQSVDHLGASVERVRKRDPRLVCSNFLAGRIPCACPEMDAMLEEEELENSTAPGKKRARLVREGGAGAMMCCQVPECRADISHLKGYHKRHKVCLGCANASHVLLDGLNKRYCQQCGKFHILPDFDEGKRSCRRKLERHNNRRRRKPADSKGVTEKEHEHLMGEEVSCRDEKGKEAELSCQPVEMDKLVESEGQLSAPGLVHGSQMVQTDSTISYTTSGDAPIEAEKGNLTSSRSPTVYNRSPSDGDNRSAFSSVCPTGRISFKLYDWNPAEFPRRLRNQIFQWLASMPVELEGYIRPGCIIFTVFIAMPKRMWIKLAEDPVPCLRNFIISPENILNGRGTMLVYLNNMIFHVIKDGTTVTEVKAREIAPRLHYVHPTCFVAGKPIEFVACGSNLLQSNLRFLFSFSGKYLACKCCISSFRDESMGSGNNVDHQVVKVCVTETAPDLLGPAFIEVENVSGLSNFIPVLIGNEEICAEMKLLQQRCTSFISKRRQLPATCSCDLFVSQQLRLSQFTLDVAWLLKEPIMEDLEFLPSIQIQRFNHLIRFLMENDSSSILSRVLHRMKVLVDRNLLADNADVGMRLFWSNMDIAKDKLYRRKLEQDPIMMSVNFIPGRSSSQTTCVPATQTPAKGLEEIEELKEESRMDLITLYGSAISPLLDKNVSRSVITAKVWQGRTSSNQFPTGSLFLTKRPAICVIAAVAVCLGVCLVFLHPQKIEMITTSIRRCLFENY